MLSFSAAFGEHSWVPVCVTVEESVIKAESNSRVNVQSPHRDGALHYPQQQARIIIRDFWRTWVKTIV